MDIKEKISDIVEKVTKDEGLMEKFKDDPVKTVESVAGIDLPNDVIDKIIDTIKSKVSVDKVTDALGSLKKLF